MRKRQGSKNGKGSHELLFLSSKYMENSGYESTRNISYSEGTNNLIKLDSEVQLLYGCWEKNENSNYLTSTGFLSSILSIISKSGVDFVSILSFGVKSLTVVCVEQKDEESMMATTTTTATHGNLSARTGRIERKEVVEVTIPKTDFDDQDLPLQQLNFHTPWSCSHLEASFTAIDGNFISILKISTYCDSMPSSMSTPIK